MKESDAQSRQVIIMDVKTGKIKTIAGKPPAIPCRAELVSLATLSAALVAGKVNLSDSID